MMKKKVITVLSIFLPILAIGIYILIEKNKKDVHETNLKKLDEDIVKILEDTNSLTYKHLQDAYLNIIDTNNTTYDRIK